MFGVSNVLSVRNPVQQDPTQDDHTVPTCHTPAATTNVSGNIGTAKLGTAFEMDGVDKLHCRGIKGKGIKEGIIDTGDDYHPPALGASFGPGHNFAGSYSLSTTIAN